MRSYGEMALESLTLLEPNLRGFAEGEWRWEERYPDVTGKGALLAAWDDAGEMLRAY
ncbi:MAG TPA: hypothetical protein VNT60_08775 [Deinococcales bacterium]|nr:hypothetical protein [Deinococcales bacterium]